MLRVAARTLAGVVWHVGANRGRRSDPPPLPRRVVDGVASSGAPRRVAQLGSSGGRSAGCPTTLPAASRVRRPPLGSPDCPRPLLRSQRQPAPRTPKSLRVGCPRVARSERSAARWAHDAAPRPGLLPELAALDAAGRRSAARHPPRPVAGGDRTEGQATPTPPRSRAQRLTESHRVVLRASAGKYRLRRGAGTSGGAPGAGRTERKSVRTKPEPTEILPSFCLLRETSSRRSRAQR